MGKGLFPWPESSRDEGTPTPLATGDELSSAEAKDVITSFWPKMAILKPAETTGKCL